MSCTILKILLIFVVSNPSCHSWNVSSFQISSVQQNQQKKEERHCVVQKIASQKHTNTLHRRTVFQSVIAISSLFFAPNTEVNNGSSIANAVTKSTVGTVDALLPILMLKSALKDIRIQLHDKGNKKEVVKQIQQQRQIPTEEQKFKQIFDQYSNPLSYKQKYLNSNAFLVYYTKGYDGPNRPNIETLSEEEELQKEQYGLRNESWIRWDTFLAELNFSDDDDTTTKDLIQYLDETIASLDSYLQLVPIDDFRMAQTQLTTAVQ